jgi:hypothetical protein
MVRLSRTRYINCLRIVLVAVALALTFQMSLASAEPVSFANPTVMLEAPEGFSPLSDAVKALKFPRGKAPNKVLGNKRATTTIAYGLRPRAMPQDQIEPARQAFTQVFSRIIAGVEFKQNKVIDLAGQRWGYMEMTSNAVDTDIYNIILFTGHRGKTLILNFNSTREDFPRYEKMLRKSIASLKLKP